MLLITGRVFLFGDDINTDYIISSRRKRNTLDPAALKAFIMEDIRPGFFTELNGDEAIIVAGESFGCGSAMEIAAQILPVNRIHVVIAKSIARSFYRNCINNGVLPLVGDLPGIAAGDILKIELGDEVRICNLTQGYEYTASAPSGEARRIFEAGGMVPYMKKQR